MIIDSGGDLFVIYHFFLTHFNYGDVGCPDA
jgi:hypothetical protein